MADVNLTCSVHCNDLLPLFCKDCDHLLCCDCVTRDHAGHKLCNVTDVIEFHQQELHDVLKNEKSIQFLERLVVDSQGEQNLLAQHTEDLLRNVIDREEEIIAQVRVWRENIMNTIIKFRDERDKYLQEKKSTISALLNKREGGFHVESERSKLEITRINYEVRRLLADARNSSGGESSDLIEFEIGPSSGDLNDMFGKLSEKEMSSDEITIDEAQKAQDMREGEDVEEEFYDCEDLQRYKFRTKPIRDVIPLQNLHTFLLSSDTVYLYDLNKEDFDAKTILSNVHQITHIPTSGDVLCVMMSCKEIKRISDGNTITTFVYTIKDNEMFKSVSSGGNEAYACASQEDYKEKTYYSNTFRINLFNESGVILKTFDFGTVHRCGYRSVMKTSNKNNYICAKSNRVELINLQQGKEIQSYTGSVGTDPASRFCTMGMTTDNENNILLAVRNDNAIHLLDKSLTFQKLLMTAEDGLYCPSSVALDRDDYLWVGCEDGHLLIVNYQYLLNTDRQTRLKLKHRVI
ncbi:uncharacterized protein LOC125676623 [Ostrea edulis]|uniref:uncharacterized protein LOC125676623 n=1 Tax=Ostrea edulis TaxID=37623 RepID=UPI0024AF487B|nr:uncharacterized protein LOC125676623 [Ostrea edulis]